MQLLMVFFKSKCWLEASVSMNELRNVAPQYVKKSFLNLIKFHIQVHNGHWTRR